MLVESLASCIDRRSMVAVADLTKVVHIHNSLSFHIPQLMRLLFLDKKWKHTRLFCGTIFDRREEIHFDVEVL